MLAWVRALFALATMVNVWPTAPRPVRLTGETHETADVLSSEQVVRFAPVVVHAILAVVLVVGLVGCVVTVRPGACCCESERIRGGRLAAAWRCR
jgi:hypothetical protein